MLKIIALVSMAVDHVGIFLLPQYGFMLRPAGALAFPLFGWQASKAVRWTHDKTYYALKLLALAVVSQPAYMLLFGVYEYNPVFSLYFGVLTVLAYSEIKRPFNRIASTLIVLLMIAFNASFLYYSVVVISYFTRRSKILFVVFNSIYFIALSFLTSFCLWYLMFIPVVLTFGDHESKIVPTWFAYVFYPAHLFLIYLVTR